LIAAAYRYVHWLVAERERYGVQNLYDIPEQLGSDRYAALIAANSI
jgi:pantothenate kinase type III